jgi:CspA family cold shock protein
VNGTVKFFNQDRGYGFIAREGDHDLFFHISQVAPRDWEPLQNDRVTFDETEDRGRPAACNVRQAA